MRIFNNNKIIKQLGKIQENKLVISICDSNLALCKVFSNKFEHLPQIEVIHGNIFKEKSDAIVSPANSFGDMGGGIDKIIDDFYSNQAQGKVLNEIKKEYFGELPVGNALVLEMNKSRFPFLIVSPTMRIPGRLSEDSINVYLSMRAILIATIKFNNQGNNKILKIILPGLGTGIGGMSYSESATQIITAYENICLGGWRGIKHPMLAPFVMRKQ